MKNRIFIIINIATLISIVCGLLLILRNRELNQEAEAESRWEKCDTITDGIAVNNGTDDNGINENEINKENISDENTDGDIHMDLHNTDMNYDSTDIRYDNTHGNNSTDLRVTLSEGFYYEPLSEELKEYITGRSYRENSIIGYDDLRHIVVKYIDFNNRVCQGELIVNVQVADDTVAIFKELFDNSYQIEKIRLVDEYNADDDMSMADNNSSAFNYRTIDSQEVISDHGYGVAIDINPLYNPYVRTGYGERDVLPVNGYMYADRNASFDHKIEKGDICYKAFISRGWKWGGEWDSPVDYQHFYKEIEK